MNDTQKSINTKNTLFIIMSNEKQLSVIIPIFNGGYYLEKTLKRLLQLASTASFGIEFILVDDGSTDNTVSVLKSYKDRNYFKIIRLSENHGKGYAIRAGLLEAHSGVICFTDADLPYGTEVIIGMFRFVQSQPSLMLLYGSRNHRLSAATNDYGLMRKFGRFFFSWVVKLALSSHIRDSQCGIKMFRRPLGDLLINFSTVDRFAFDVELFAIVFSNKLSNTDFPVELNHQKHSSVRIFVDTAGMLFNILRVRNKLKRNLY